MRYLMRILALPILGLLAAPQAGAQNCPAGLAPSGDGYCISAGQAYCGGGMVCPEGMRCIGDRRCMYVSGCYPGDVLVGNRSCIPVGATLCPGGGHCPAGQQCTTRGTCTGGPPATGPMCGGARAPMGSLCTPDGKYYDPQSAKLCGTALCDIRDECGANRCVSPFHQSVATRAGSRPAPGGAVSPGAKTGLNDGQ